MKNRMCKFTPVIMFFGSMILFTAMLCIMKYQNNHSQFSIYIAYIVFTIFQLTNSIIYSFSIRKLYRQVNIDALTGLCNRKFFNEIIYKMKVKYPFSVIFIDIDNFKIINDTYGHMIGDQVLQQFAEILQSNTRKNDIITRWGGEEFVIILSETSIEDAYKIGNRIRRTVERFIFCCVSITCNITVSIGIASAKPNMDIGIEQLLKIADEALYKAKQKKNHISAIT